MAELIIQSGKLQGKRLVLPPKEVFVGRDDDCHVRLASSLISRKHCSLHSTPEGVWVTDLSSQNGTFVNEVAITEKVLLKAGDTLQVGAILFQVPPSKAALDAVPSKAAGEKASSDKVAEKSGRISDAEIASWLTDEFEKSPVKSSDTTIIKNPSTPAAKPVTAAPVATPAPVQHTAESARRPHRTVKEQAAEIIRRHWSEVRSGKPPAA